MKKHTRFELRRLRDDLVFVRKQDSAARVGYQRQDQDGSFINRG